MVLRAALLGLAKAAPLIFKAGQKASPLIQTGLKTATKAFTSGELGKALTGASLFTLGSSLSGAGFSGKEIGLGLGVAGGTILGGPLGGLAAGTGILLRSDLLSNPLVANKDVKTPLTKEEVKTPFEEKETTKERIAREIKERSRRIQEDLKEKSKDQKKKDGKPITVTVFSGEEQTRREIEIDPNVPIPRPTTIRETIPKELGSLSTEALTGLRSLGHEPLTTAQISSLKKVGLGAAILGAGVIGGAALLKRRRRGKKAKKARKKLTRPSPRSKKARKAGKRKKEIPPSRSRKRGKVSRRKKHVHKPFPQEHTGSEAQFKRKGGLKVRHTKKGQPFVILPNGRARFIKKSK